MDVNTELLQKLIEDIKISTIGATRCDCSSKELIKEVLWDSLTG